MLKLTIQRLFNKEKRIYICKSRINFRTN